MKLDNVTLEWEMGQTVWLKVEPDMKGMITGVILRPGPSLAYFVGWGDGDEELHYDFELTDEKPADFGRE